MKHSLHAQTLLCVVLLWTGGTRAGAPEDRSAPDRQADPPRVIRARGRLEPTGYEELRGTIMQPRAVLFVAPPGETVKKGDLLVELDAYALMEQDREQSVRMKKAEVELAARQASLPGAKQAAADAVAIAERARRMAQRQVEAYRTLEYPPEKDALTNQAALAQERATVLEERRRTLQAAIEKPEGKPPMQEYLEVSLAFRQAKIDALGAENRLKLLQEVHHPRRIEELELVIAQRELDLLRARNELEQTTREGKMALELAELDLRLEKDRLDRLMQEIKACRIHAPRNGTVFSPPEGEIQPGDAVRTNQVLVRVADLTQLKLDAGLSLPLARRIAPGQTATVRCEAIPGRTFPAHFTRIKALANPEGGDADDAIVTVRLDDPVKDLRPGMIATFEINLSDTDPGQARSR